MGKKKIGLASTIPIEVIFAAGMVPVDLNNIFISDKNRLNLIQAAENKGIPRSFCAWVKGIYSAIIKSDINEIIIVTQGDCSSIIAISDLLISRGIKVIPFSYPALQNKDELKNEIDKLIFYFKTSWEAVTKVKQKLDSVREKIHTIDYLTWSENIVTGFENHYFSVCTSDMKGDLLQFEKEIDLFLKNVKYRQPYKEDFRLGFVGVPPIVDDLYSFIEQSGGRVVFNEVQRQFSMPYGCSDMLKQYLMYTYPYRIKGRLEDIEEEICHRRIDGIIHYIQSFCHHQLDHTLLKDNLNVPILQLECDYPGTLDPRAKMRIESFIDMMRHKR